MIPEGMAAWVAESRARQGLGPTITDPATQQQLAMRVADVLVRQKGGDERDGGGPDVVNPPPQPKQHSTKTRPAAGKVGDADGSA
jgi:hypothetical protein